MNQLRNIQRIICLLLLAAVGGCAERADGFTDRQPISRGNQASIDAHHVLEEMQNAVKHYANEPLYYVYIDHEQCVFQLLVNDIPVLSYLEDGSITTPIILNSYISKSGKQKLTYRLYPQNTRSNGVGSTSLTPYTKMKLSLFSRNKADTLSSFENQLAILEHKSLTKDDGETFIAAEQDYYEYTLTFEAEVPYTLTDLNHSKDLRKLDKELLAEKAVDAYAYLKHLIDDQEADEYYALRFKSMVNPLISEYDDEQTIADDFRTYTRYLDKSVGITLEPIKGTPYLLKFYAEGKLISLEHDSMDPRLRFSSLLWGKYKTPEGGTRAAFATIYLHIPEGKDAFEIW